MLRSLFNIIESKKYISAFGFLLVCKLIFFFWFVSYQSPSIEGSWIQIPADDEGYLSTVENLIEKGIWYYDHLNMEAPRVPGQSLSYGFFRLFFGLAYAVNALLLFQVFIYCVSIVFLGKTLQNITKSNLSFFICILLFTVDLYNSAWNNYVTLAESLGNSFALIGMCYFYKYYNSKQVENIFLAGFFIGISCFYKVVNIVIIMCVGLFLLSFLFKEKETLKRSIKVVFLFSIPFIIFESIWISRNALATSEFIPIQQIKGAPVGLEDDSFICLNCPSRSCIKFLKSFGGNWVPWNVNSEMAWFNTAEYNSKNGFVVNQDVENVFPDWIYTEELTKGLLIVARDNWHKSLNENEDDQTRIEFAENAILIFRAFKKNIIKNHPFRYHVTSRLVYLSNFFLHSGTYYVPFRFEDAPMLMKIAKLFLMALYYVVLLLGSIGLIRSFVTVRKRPFMLLFTSVFIGYVVLYCVVFRTNELRYNSMMYICLLIFSIDVIFSVLQTNIFKVRLLALRKLMLKV